MKLTDASLQEHAEAQDLGTKLNLERKAHEKTRTELAKARKVNVALHDKLQKAREDKERKVAKMHEQQKADSDSQRAVADKELAKLLHRNKYLVMQRMLKVANSVLRAQVEERWRKWRAIDEHDRIYAGNVRRALASWTKRTSRAAFTTWKTYVAESMRQKRLMKRCIAYHNHRSEAQVFLQWSHFCQQ